MDNIRRIYILTNWLGLKVLFKGGSPAPLDFRVFSYIGKNTA